MISRPAGMGAFHFVVLATLRTAQLMRGCRPRVDGAHKAMVIAQFEVSQGKVEPLMAPAGDAESPLAGETASLIPSI
jgi:DNA-directed RNA polymerase subunit K/omega